MGSPYRAQGSALRLEGILGVEGHGVPHLHLASHELLVVDRILPFVNQGVSSLAEVRVLREAHPIRSHGVAWECISIVQYRACMSQGPPEDEGEDSPQPEHEEDVVAEGCEIAHVQAGQVDATLRKTHEAR